MRGRTFPRDEAALSAVLDYLEALTAAREGSPQAAVRRAACDEAYRLKVRWREPEPTSNASAIPDWLAFLEAMRGAVPIMSWLGSTVLAGVLGNSAHELLKKAVRRHREAIPLSADEALLLAETAIRVRCHELGISQPPLDMLRHDVYQAGDGRWVLIFWDEAGSGQQFFVRIPPGRPNDEQVSLDTFVPDPARRVPFSIGTIVNGLATEPLSADGTSPRMDRLARRRHAREGDGLLFAPRLPGRRW